MKHEAKELGLKPAEVLAAIEDHREGKDVYIVGCTNVGKSTFINRILKEVTGEGDVITTSYFPGTTLDIIEIPLSDGKSLVDTPGIINHHQMAHFIDKRDLKVITPKKEIKPKEFQLNEEKTLFFGGLARFDYVKGGRRSFSCHFSSELNIHRTKLEKADELYRNHVGEMLTPPRQEDIDSFPELVKQSLTIKEGKTDIVFSGLGWVTVHEPGAIVAAYVPKGVHVLLRKALI